MSLNASEWVIRIAVLLFAITIHEYAHGKAALSLGDPTAKNAGRLTLNPIKHIDPLGAICLFLFHFGWARPVPVDNRYFQNKRRDTIIMALSGPVANIAAAFLTGLFLRFYYMQIPVYQEILLYMLVMNIGLGLFNLLPIPPLDGSHVLENLLPRSVLREYYQIRTYAPFILIGVLLMDSFLHINILGRLLTIPIFKIAHLFGGDNLFRLLGYL